MRYRIRSALAGFLGLFFISTASMGALTPYSQDFEGLSGMEIGDGWTFFVNVFDAGNGYLFGYGGAAPNGPQISALATGEGDVDQGDWQLSVFSDYNCCDPDTGHNEPGGLVETNVYQEQSIVASNVGETWSFNFDAKMGNLTGSSTASAFIKVLDPANDFSQSAIVSLDMTSIAAGWGSFQLDLTIDAAWEGQILQFGFASNAGGFESSGVFYDNVVFGGGVGPGIEPYFDDFESYNDQDPAVLGDAGYLIFGNVSDSGGNPVGQYGPFPAPNQTGAFSGVSVGEGGPDQGAQQLNTFSDYNNVDDHMALNLIESIVYRERPITEANVGETWLFSFDAKLGNLAPPTTAEAFIKTIDPSNGFNATNYLTIDTSTTPATWQGYQLQLTIDAGLPGQLFQIGFSNTATDFNPSGVFYDNISLALADFPDADGDGIADDIDNCTNVVNPGQEDVNGDNIGNICDADVAGQPDVPGVVSFEGEITDSTAALSVLIPAGTPIDGIVVSDVAAVNSGLVGPADIISIDIRLGGFCVTTELVGCMGVGSHVPITSIDAAAVTFSGGILSGGSSQITAFSPTFMLPIDVIIDHDTGTVVASTDGIGSASATFVPKAGEDCLVNFLDLQAIKNAFFSNPASPSWNAEVDFDNSNLVNFADLQILEDQFFGPPGPSAAGCN